MRIVLLLVLLMSSTAFAVNLDANTLSKSITATKQANNSDEGSFAIVYGGQDISRGSVVSSGPFVNVAPVLVG